MSKDPHVHAENIKKAIIYAIRDGYDVEIVHTDKGISVDLFNGLTGTCVMITEDD